MPAPTIAVIDYVNAGHVPTYHRLIVLSLLRMGYRVLSLCGWQDKVAEFIQALEPGVRPRLETPRFGALQVPLTAETASRMLRWLPMRDRLWPLIRGNNLLRGWRAWKRWQTSAAIAGECANRFGAKDLLVLFSHIDDFLNPYMGPQTVDRLFPLPWTSMYLGLSKHRFPAEQGRGLFREERAFLARNCRSVATLDEGMNRRFEQWLPGKPVVDFPDITDEAQPRLDHPLAREIRARAAGRPVIGLLGMLQPRKGIDTFLRVSQMPEAKHWFFVLAGPMAAVNFPEKTVRMVQEAEQQKVDNLFVWTKPLADGEDFNSVFGCCQAIFAVYEDFVFNSNIHTKCAFLKVPVLVATGYLAEERINRWRLGVAVPQRDPLAAVAGLRALLASQDLVGRPLQPDFSGYASLHGREALSRALQALVQTHGAQRNAQALQAF